MTKLKINKNINLLKTVFVISIITLILLELTLQTIYYFRGNIRKYPFAKNMVFSVISLMVKPPDHFFWQNYFLRNYNKKNKFVYYGLYQPNQFLGWSAKPHSRYFVTGEGAYTINAQGYRSLFDFTNQPDKYQVLALGDSFTFGDEIDDLSTWPYQLEKIDPRLNVYNMGGSGYGLDQMLLVLKQEIHRYKPDLIIVGFVTDDLQRALIDFRDYKKPSFEIINGKLIQKQTSIGTIEETIAETTQQIQSAKENPTWLDSFRTLNLIEYLYEKYWNNACNYACRKLNTLILEEMGNIANQNNADFMIVYMPVNIELTDPNFYYYGEKFFESYRKSHPGIFLNPRPDFLSATFEKAPGHYHYSENKLLSELIYKKIQTTPSWSKKSE